MGFQQHEHCTKIWDNDSLCLEFDMWCRSLKGVTSLHTVACSTISLIVHALLILQLWHSCPWEVGSVFPSPESGQAGSMAGVTLCKDIPPLIYSFACWWTFGCFQFCAIRNKAAVNICVQVIVWTCTFFSLGVNGWIIWQAYGLLSGNCQIIFAKRYTILHTC